MCHLRFPEEIFPEKLEPSTHRSRKGEVTRMNKDCPTDAIFNQEGNRLFKDFSHFTSNIGIRKNSFSSKKWNYAMEKMV
jgi:hypothetical protein